MSTNIYASTVSDRVFTRMLAKELVKGNLTEGYNVIRFFSWIRVNDVYEYPAGLTRVI
jgi:hypothetical protein